MLGKNKSFLLEEITDNCIRFVSWVFHPHLLPSNPPFDQLKNVFDQKRCITFNASLARLYEEDYTNMTTVVVWGRSVHVENCV